MWGGRQAICFKSALSHLVRPMQDIELRHRLASVHCSIAGNDSALCGASACGSSVDLVQKIFARASIGGFFYDGCNAEADLLILAESPLWCLFGMFCLVRVRPCLVCDPVGHPKTI